MCVCGGGGGVGMLGLGRGVCLRVCVCFCVYVFCVCLDRGLSVSTPPMLVRSLFPRGRRPAAKADFCRGNCSSPATWSEEKMA